MRIKLFILPILFVLLVSPVFAKEDNRGRTISEEKKLQAQTRLENSKLRMCEKREAAINNRADSLARLVNNMIEKFEAITERVMNFYEDTVVPSGNEVANYDELVDEIDAKKQAALDALTAAQDALGDFSCDSDDPKGLFADYREAMQNVKTALKEYRTSIKNLIVAVHTAMEESEEETEE